jgi:hypothetical protein
MLSGKLVIIPHFDCPPQQLSVIIWQKSSRQTTRDEGLHGDCQANEGWWLFLIIGQLLAQVSDVLQG